MVHRSLLRLATRPVAKRARILRGEGTIEMVSKALAMQRSRDVIRMEVGDPDFETPSHITASAISALQAGQTHYEAAGGSPGLRKAVANHLERSRPGLKADPDQVLCMPGGKPVIFHTIAALCEEGDEVIYPNPGFPAYETTIEWSGATAVPLRLDESTGFRFRHDDLRRLVSPRTKLIILCSPGNPTGGVLTSQDLDAVADVARESGAYVLSDEIYSSLIFDGQHDTILLREGMPERCVLLDGCSKAFAMTGWRLGFGLFPKELVEPARNLAINSWTCIPPFVAAGAITALDTPKEELDYMRLEYAARRDLLFERLNQLPGISVAVKPAGAMYLLANVTGTSLSSRDFADRLLQEEAVSLLDGRYFGDGGSPSLNPVSAWRKDVNESNTF